MITGSTKEQRPMVNDKIAEKKRFTIFLSLG